MNTPADRAPAERRVWDLPVRIFHWSLVLAVAGAWASHEFLGYTWFAYHKWFGYAVLVLVSFRIVWGLVGTRHALFWNFVRNPLATARYVFGLLRGRHPVFVGHNPLGACMVILLLLALLTQAVLGLFGDDDSGNLGPLNGYVSHDGGLDLTSNHRLLFWWIVGAIALHIIGVIVHRLTTGENLVRAMFTGRKPADRVPANEAIGSSRILLALLVAGLVAGVLAWVVLHAPPPQNLDDF